MEEEVGLRRKLLAHIVRVTFEAPDDPTMKHILPTTLDFPFHYGASTRLRDHPISVKNCISELVCEFLCKYSRVKSKIFFFESKSTEIIVVEKIKSFCNFFGKES